MSLLDQAPPRMGTWHTLGAVNPDCTGISAVSRGGDVTGDAGDGASPAGASGGALPAYRAGAGGSGSVAGAVFAPLAWQTSGPAPMGRAALCTVRSDVRA